MDKVCTLLSKISKGMQKFELFIGTCALFLLLTIMLLNAAGRYVLNLPILWADEVNNYLFVWFGFMGCAYIMGDDGHMRVTAITNIFSKKIKFIIKQLMSTIMLFMFAVYVRSTIELLDKVTYSGILRIPLKYVYLILPLSFALMCFHIINNILQDVNNSRLQRKGG